MSNSLPPISAIDVECPSCGRTRPNRCTRVLINSTSHASRVWVAGQVNSAPFPHINTHGLMAVWVEAISTEASQHRVALEKIKHAYRHDHYAASVGDYRTIKDYVENDLKVALIGRGGRFALYAEVGSES